MFSPLWSPWLPCHLCNIIIIMGLQVVGKTRSCTQLATWMIDHHQITTNMNYLPHHHPLGDHTDLAMKLHLGMEGLSPPFLITYCHTILLVVITRGLRVALPLVVVGVEEEGETTLTFQITPHPIILTTIHSLPLLPQVTTTSTNEVIGTTIRHRGGNASLQQINFIHRLLLILLFLRLLSLQLVIPVVDAVHLRSWPEGESVRYNLNYTTCIVMLQFI